MRLGVFGGTFDPIHWGHLILAEQCREQRRLDKVLFVPAGQPPHKLAGQITAGKLRREMVELAIAGNATFAVSDVELRRPGPSYTVETLRELRREYAGDELFLLIGSDSLSELPQWRDPAKVAELASLVVVTRPGAPLTDLRGLEGVLTAEQIGRVRENVVEMPLVGISATDLRQRVFEGRSVRYLVPRAVEMFIETHGLYQSAEGTDPARRQGGTEKCGGTKDEG